MEKNDDLSYTVFNVPFFVRAGLNRPEMTHPGREGKV